MRAFNNLKALVSCFNISLLVFPPGFRSSPAPNSTLKEICSDIYINISNPVYDYACLFKRIREKIYNKLFPDRGSGESWHWMTPYRKKNLENSFKGVSFDTIHIYRITHYVVFKVFSTTISYDRLQLDLDDIESDKWSQLKNLHQLHGNSCRAQTAAHQAAKFKDLEFEFLPAVDKVFVCSEADSLTLRKLYQCKNVTVLPNVYTLPDENKKMVSQSNGVFRMLFVGSLGYLPNADAIFNFCENILPELRKISKSKVQLLIIGNWKQMPKDIKVKIQQEPEIKLVGTVNNVRPYYEKTDAVIVPLRVGSGTRIKILEAFAYQVPVVSTSKGIEGLEANHDEHALIADTPEDFAMECNRLMTEPALRDNLTKNAKLLVETKYSPERLVEILCK